MDQITELENVLEARKVGKLYSRFQSTARRRVGQTLFQVLMGRQSQELKPTKQEFWALQDIDLSLRKGEAVGIIGLNGSGKTTLLRILAGQIVPDAGIVRVRGRTASMIDLTAGFHVTASGRENIYLRGAALGRSRKEVNETIDEVIAFADIGDAIDAPIATYSSGMTMRLAFSIMVATTPDILFIDEVLAVGDFQFRQKCLNRLRDIRENTSFVFVSHSMHDISRFCDRVIVLQKGVRVFEGLPDDAINYYHEQIEAAEKKKKHKGKEGKNNKSILGDQFHNKSVIKEVVCEWSNGNGEVDTEFNKAQDMYLKIQFNMKRECKFLTIGVPLYDASGLYVAGFSSIDVYPKGIPHSIGDNTINLKISANQLRSGEYYSNTIIRDGAEYIYRYKNEDIYIKQGGVEFYGLVNLQHEWSIE